MCAKNRRFKSCFRWCAVLASSLLTAGCAGTHFYSSGEHELAKKANTAFEEVNLAGKLDEQRKRVTEITEQDVKAVREDAAAERNQVLITLIGSEKPLRDLDTRKELGAWEWLESRINGRSIRLLGVNANEEQRRIQLVFNKIKGREKALTNLQEGIEAILRSEGHGVQLTWTCPLSSNSILKVDETLKELGKDYEKQCKRLVELRKEARAAGTKNTRLHNLTERITKTEDALTSYLTDLANKQNALAKHKEALEKVAEDKIDELAEKLETTLNELGDIAAGVNELQELGMDDLALAGKIEQLEEQRGLIGEVLQAFLNAGATPVVELPADASVAAKVAYSMGVINREVGAALRYPQVSEMVLQNERLRIQIAGLQQRAANATARLALLRRLREAMVAEAAWLVKTNSSLKNMEDDCKSGTIQAAFEEKIDCREQIARTLVAYGNSYSIGQATSRGIQSQLIGLRHEAALDNSEIALAQWHNLIGVPLGQLNALYESGIKPDTLARFIQAIGNAAGLTYIGTQVD